MPTPPVSHSLTVHDALLYLAERAGRRRLTMLERVYLRDRGTCRLCHEAVLLADTAERKASLDHITPRASGGPTTLNNLRLAHAQCNSDRSAGTADGWGDETPESHP